MHKNFTFWHRCSSNLVTSFLLLFLLLLLFLWSTLCIGSFWAVHSLPEGNCGMFAVSFCCFLALLYLCTDFEFICWVLIFARVLLHRFMATLCMHLVDCMLHECIVSTLQQSNMVDCCVCTVLINLWYDSRARALKTLLVILWKHYEARLGFPSALHHIHSLMR